MKKIKITEEQLKKVVSVMNEDTYDQAMTTHLKEKGREVFMSREEAKLLHTLALSWCEGRVNHPDCEELVTISKRISLDKL